MDGLDRTTFKALQMISWNRFKDPTVNEVATIIVDEFATKDRDIVVNLRGGGLQRISDLHPAYDPLQFPLLFPFGEQGWSTTV
ncbi:Transcriptional factor B3 [Phytophthora megakarya]|uniref:Transcriptional factor B3 n=1 Tax=Phytophthora megakarya TaxID=4795 RepID=A0A225VBS3_9STRA|nr:Transcriptional factor B3 [Phytophthora megakarya]